ncbi:MAG TPA: haloacid dehalogenase type II [Xanthobacteraceae bacterium]|nr:haloacid dehalogenase type II [Xanthobacteraceae bacterium]
MDSVRSIPSVLVFDVNETLLDIESMAPIFERIFGDKRVLRVWFDQLIMYSMTVTLADQYKDFWALGVGVLQMVGSIHGVPVNLDDVEALAHGMRTMPAHADAAEGLRQLQAAGFRMVTLTNSTPIRGSRTPLESAGLDRFFEGQFHIDAVRAYKPTPAVYHMVAKELGVPTAACCMVAAHVWDTIGGQSAGMAGALLTRPGNAALPVPGLPQPNVMAADLPSLAAQLIRMWRASS